MSCADRNYEAEEDARRKEIFTTNLKKIEMHNYLHAKGLSSYKLGITPFTDMVSVVICYAANMSEILACGIHYDHVTSTHHVIELDLMLAQVS